MNETRNPRHKTDPKNHEWTEPCTPAPNNNGEMTWGDGGNGKKAKRTPLHRRHSDSAHLSLSRRFASGSRDQNAVLVNTSVGLGFGNTVSLPGLPNVNSVLNASPCESRP